MIYFGTVTSVGDEANGGRIRVKIPLDGFTEPKEGWPYAFPLLPKTVQTMPKKGEMVFVFLQDDKNRKSSRFYVGPIISQQQFHYIDKTGAKDYPLSLINSASTPSETTNHFSSTFGSFPRIEDVGLVGRKSEDIILKEDEVNIRCGVRNHADGSGDNQDIVGEIIFNSTNPTYIQLKHQRSGKLDTYVNVVGGHINLMSNNDATAITSSMRELNNVAACNETTNNTNTGKTEVDFSKIMAELHEVPYGDVLVELLELIQSAILNHTHPWAQLPPTQDSIISRLSVWGQSTVVPKSLSQLLLSETVNIS